MNNFNDFHTVKDLKFDIEKLQEGLKQVLKIKNYDDANGIKSFRKGLAEDEENNEIENNKDEEN